MSDFNTQILDSLVGTPLQPRAMFGGYEGADRQDRTLALWQPATLTADQSVLPDKITAEARVQDLFRNDAYLAGAGSFYRDSVVGSYFRLNLEPHWKLLGLSETWAEEFAEEVEERWAVYAESEECHADASRRSTFTGMVRLAVLSYLQHQEILTSVEWLRDRSRVSRTAFLQIDPDRLANPMGKDDIFNNDRIRGGIKRRRNGEHLSYFIHDDNPLGALLNGNWGVREIPARKPWGRRQIIYISEVGRIDQTRGISQVTSAIRETKLGRRFRDIMIQNALAKGTYAATLESALPTEFLMNALGKTAIVDPAAKVMDYMVGHGEAMQAFTRDAKRLSIDGVRIPHLPPGTKLNIQNAGGPGGLGDAFEGSVLRYTAAGLGMTYEEFTRDLRDTNYSSIKAGMAMTSRTMRAFQAMIASRYASQMLQCWMEEEINNGRFTTMPSNAPNIYEGYNLQYYCESTWHATGLGQVDELKETQAALLRISRGLSTYEKEISRLHGADWKQVFAQVAKERETLDRLGIVWEESNMLNAATGNVGEPTTETGDNTTKGART